MKYKIVPVEPTHDAIRKGADSVSLLTHKGADACYRAMVSAAPEFVVMDEMVEKSYWALWAAIKAHNDLSPNRNDVRAALESFIRSFGETT